MMSNYISHHGILGMRWGIRRFQPYGQGGYERKDGETGKVIGEAKKKLGPRALEIEEAKKSSGVVTIDPDTDIIKKGSTIQRIASVGEPIDDRRKYVSLTPRDNADYQVEYDLLPIDGTPALINYVAKNDIKVASGKAVVDYILNEYGDVKFKDAVSTNEWATKYYKKLIKKYGNITVNELAKGSRREDIMETIDTVNESTDERVLAGEKAVWSLLNKLENDQQASSKLFDHYKSKGYDAIVDPVDYENASREYPVILLNPRKNIKKISEDAYW